MIFCRVSIKWLIPLPDWPISSLDLTVTRLVKSPWPDSISSIIVESSSVCFCSGLTTAFITTKITPANAATAIAIKITETATLRLYKSSWRWIFSFTISSFLLMSSSIASPILVDQPFMTSLAFETAAAESPPIAVCISSTVVSCASVIRANVSFINWISSAVK